MIVKISQKPLPALALQDFRSREGETQRLSADFPPESLDASARERKRTVESARASHLVADSILSRDRATGKGLSNPTLPPCRTWRILSLGECPGGQPFQWSSPASTKDDMVLASAASAQMKRRDGDMRTPSEFKRSTASWFPCSTAQAAADSPWATKAAGFFSATNEMNSTPPGSQAAQQRQ